MIKRQNPWVAVLLGGIGLLINLNYLTAEDYVFFFFYLLGALFLVAQTAFAKHYSWLRHRSIHYPRQSARYFLAAVLCVSTLTLSLAWLVPGWRVYPIETVARTEIPSKIPGREDIQGFWRNFFAVVRANRPTLTYGVSDALDRKSVV